MHFNMKHFVITIVSIFLALGIGIAIGATIDGQQLFIEEQGRLVEQIEKSIDKVKEENNKLVVERDKYKDELDSIDEFFDKKAKRIAKDNPIEKSILVIDLFSDFGKDNVKDILKDFGVQRVDEVKIVKDYNTKEVEVLQALKDEFKIPAGEASKLNEEMITLLLNEEENFDRVEKLLRDLDMIDVKGSLDSIKTNYDYIVIVDGNENFEDEGYNSIRNIIIDNLSGNEIPFMAVESMDRSVSSIKYYKEHRVSTIDNIDKGLGKMSMILMLYGEVGNYGVKEDSDSILPLNSCNLEVPEEEIAEEVLEEEVLEEEAVEGEVSSDEGQ